jgi:acyl-CoA reductase-like NAD-dependent aldehyde dehydrogenase
MTMQISRTQPAPAVHARLLVGGDWYEGTGRVEVHNPARPDELVGTIVRGTPDDVRRAVAAAKAAQPPWAALGAHARASAISSGLDALVQGGEERAVLYVRENGKTLAEARGEVLGLPDRMRSTLSYADALESTRALESTIGRTFVGFRPFGVVVSIVPWNAPVNLAFTQIVAALLAGNAVVVKPPETSPLALIACIEPFARALPPGVLNVVTGLPDEIGDALTTHPDVAKIVFTGSIRAARTIGGNAAQTIKSVTLELGGNDAAIVFEDVDLGEATMNRMSSTVFGLAGQVCAAIKRIYVHESVAEAFQAAFRRASDQIVVGDGLEPGVTMGPLHTAAALARATGLVNDARARGARVDPVGRIADEATFARGYFMQPNIVTSIDAGAPLVVEEQFCPSIPIVTYRDLDDAFARANDSVYGLSGSIWSKDVERALQLARRFEAGVIGINTNKMYEPRAPLGGVKQSGIGRRGGLEGVLDYVQAQAVTTCE